MFKNNILSKSFNLEVFKSTTSILIILFLLVVGSRFVSYFEQASEGLIDPSIILYAVFLRFPDFISLLLPLSFFIGILITVSRLYADREIYAYFSTGISPITLIKFIFPQAIIYMVFTLILSLYIAPVSKQVSNELLKVDTFEEQIASLSPGEIVSIKGSKSFITVSENNEAYLKNVIFFNDDGKDSILISSDILSISSSQLDYELLFKDGSLTTGIFSDDPKIISSFKNFKFPLANNQTDASTSFENIFSSINIDDPLGFQWSISLSITIIVLMVIAIYIGKVEPRQGRLSVILPGMLIYILYLSLLLLGRDHIVQNNQTEFNLIFIHLIFIFFAILLYLRDRFFILIFNEITKKLFYRLILATILILFILWAFF
ncbi:LptF/LptG family permease [Gammaproteobacteria bacterium]|nr:LptF/LptG family permease [Gammaproteobacteria bacterium]MDC3359693.1 LptF/LptG family permease [Gammaproteobacteria bacterium]